MIWNDIRSGKIKLKIGDMVYTHGKSAVSAHIRVISGLYDLLKKGEPTIANHVGCISKAIFIKGSKGTSHHYDILEALHHFKERSIYSYDDGQTDILIVRDKTIDDRMKLHIVSEVRRKYKGKIYNYGAIVAQIFDNLVSYVRGKEIYILTRLHFLPGTICSRAWAVEIHKATGYTYGCPPYATTPNKMIDYDLAHPSKKELIFYTKRMKEMIDRQINGTIEVNP